MSEDAETLIAEFAHDISCSPWGVYLSRSAVTHFATKAYQAIAEAMESERQTQIQLHVMRARAPKITP